MTGQELYEKQREVFPEYELPPWENLTPFRQANWNTTAADYVRKRLDDEDVARFEDEGGPPEREDD